MDWLAKASDLLDKVDQLAAEKLVGGEEDFDDEAVLALLDEAEHDDDESPEDNSSTRDSHEPAGVSPRAELKGSSEVARLKKALQKKSAHVEQLVASQVSCLSFSLSLSLSLPLPLSLCVCLSLSLSLSL